MPRVFELDVSESAEYLETLLKREKDVRKKERLQFLYWYRTGQAKTRQALAALLHRSQCALGNWVHAYRTQGLEGLLTLRYRGGNVPPSIPPAIQAEIRAKLAQPEGFAGYKDIQGWLLKEKGLEVPYSTVFATVKYRLNGHLKVPRPQGVQHDPDAVEGFKKTFPRF